MILLGENIHIISPKIKEMLLLKDSDRVSELVRQQAKNLDYIDLNIGPAKKNMENILSWLVEIVQKNSDLKISLDTTNYDEMANAIKHINDTTNTFLNSTSADNDRLEKLSSLAVQYDSNLIALTMERINGIPKTADGRLELAFEIQAQCEEKGIPNNKLFFDPLILPITVDQSQALEAINTIQMIKNTFENPVNTVIGLSNISNGAPKELRPLLNRTFLALAFGAGLDAAIVDAFDTELIKMVKMLSEDNPLSEKDFLYRDIANSVRNFTDIEDVTFDSKNQELASIYATAKVLLNKEIYSNKYTSV